MSSDITSSPSSPLLDLSGLPGPVVKSIEQLVESLREEIASQARSGAAHDSTPLRGRFADLKLAIPKEDIDETQREAWHSFPREFPEPGS
jgi:hypothetical protein